MDKTIKQHDTDELRTSDDQAHLRKLWRQYHMDSAARFKAWAAGGYQHPPPTHRPFPDELRSLTCGAKTRTGTPCKRRDLYLSGRCRLHGGLSTGPMRK
ncbi:MAG: HGGxSTG domain-containing protein [Pseudomonas sp.]